MDALILPPPLSKTPPTAVARAGARWAGFVAEAAARFQIPPRWIFAVMQAESAGSLKLNGRPITSPAGAMGLMQLMPATWAQIRARYGLGSNPYDPRDNIIAGTAYLRLLYDRYGAPAFFAAYNAGPARLDAYLLNGEPLPSEALAYVHAVLSNQASEVLGGPFPAVVRSADPRFSPPPSLFVARSGGAAAGTPMLGSGHAKSPRGGDGLFVPVGSPAGPEPQ